MDNAKKINEIEQQIKTLEKEKRVIQEECSHKETQVRFEEGSNSMRLYCCNCNHLLGWPSQVEIDKFLNPKVTHEL